MQCLEMISFFFFYFNYTFIQDEEVEEKVAEVSVEPENTIPPTGRRIRPTSFTRPFNRAVINKETIKECSVNITSILKK